VSAKLWHSSAFIINGSLAGIKKNNNSRTRRTYKNQLLEWANFALMIQAGRQTDRQTVGPKVTILISRCRHHKLQKNFVRTKNRMRVTSGELLPWPPGHFL